MVLIFFGVSSADKATIGRLLSTRFGWRFEDGDEYHSGANWRKIGSGTPLTNAEREQRQPPDAHDVGRNSTTTGDGYREHISSVSQIAMSAILTPRIKLLLANIASELQLDLSSKFNFSQDIAYF